MTITLASTTDSAEQVEAALGLTKTETPAVEPPKADTPPAAVDEKAPPAEAKPDEEDEGSAAGKALAAQKGKLQQRIDTLVRERYDARREADRLAAELEAIRKGLPSPKKEEPAATPTPVVAAPTVEKPVQKDDEGIEDYLERLAEWKLDIKLAARDKAAADAKAKADEEAAAKQQAEDDAKAHEARKTRMEKAKAAHADWDQVFQASANVPFSPIMQQHAGESELGPEILYYLATHPSECTEIAHMAPAHALVALGRIEAKLETAAADTSTVVTTTPEPIAAVPEPIQARPISNAPVMVSRVSGGGGVGAIGKDPNKMTYQEHKAWREKGGGR